MHENDFFNEDLLCALAGVAGEDNVLMSEPMREHTTFKIGGPADVFVTPDTEQGLVATLDTCYRCDLPLTIVGNGSDLLVGDKGIRGIVVALGEGLSDITVDGAHVTAAAGALLSDVAAAAAEAGLTGMEPISGIPGSVGGACYMNAGAYGACMADVLESVRVYKPARQLDDGTRGSGNIIEFDVDELNLGYRKSRIADDGFIVLSATFNLAPGNAAMIKADMDDYRQRREDKQPLDMPSAGSTFKRPEGYFAGKVALGALEGGAGARHVERLLVLAALTVVVHVGLDHRGVARGKVEGGREHDKAVVGDAALAVTQVELIDIELDDIAAAAGTVVELTSRLVDAHGLQHIGHAGTVGAGVHVAGAADRSGDARDGLHAGEPGLGCRRGDIREQRARCCRDVRAVDGNVGEAFAQRHDDAADALIADEQVGAIAHDSER